MKPALQVFTPTVRPLNYDALASRLGCEDETGATFLNIQPFTRLCVFEHDPDDYFFNKLPTVSHQAGPDVQGQPLPHQYGWTVWQATEGLRVAKVSRITPPADATGQPSALFPTFQTPGLSFCFNSDGLIHIAVEKTPPDYIELRRYTDTTGTMAAPLSFPGRQPLLFNASLLAPKLGVVCYYLKAELPFVIFARFAADNFAVEHIVMPDLRVNITSLRLIRAIGNYAKLYATDVDGRDVTLTTPPQAIQLTSAASVSVGFVAGAMFPLTAQGEDTSSKSKITIGFYKGAIFDGTAETQSIPAEKSTIDVGFEGGEMNRLI